MRDLLTRLKSFAIFDLPVNYNYLNLRFRQIHSKQGILFPSWPTKATTQSLISDYWKNALKHYVFLLTLGMIGVLALVSFSQSSLSLAVLGLISFLIYLPMYFMVYRPILKSEVMPKLATIAADFEGKERLRAEKCKQAQMSNAALAIIFYVFTKTSGIPLNKVDMQLGNQLMTLFGSSPDSLQKALKLITCKSPAIGPHKQTELEKSFEEARSFFMKLGFSRGLEIVDHLERKCRRLQQ